MFNTRRGITLVELMSIVVIIGVVSAMAIPRFGRTINRLRFRNSARQMVSNLRLARSNAITHKQQVGVNFDPNGETMTLFVDTHNPGSFTYETGDSVLAVDSLAREFEWIFSSFGNSSVFYRPNGSASATGQIYFLSYNNEDFINWGYIDILASTGRTKLGDLWYY
jgi:MSHA pilin protein MshC